MKSQSFLLHLATLTILWSHFTMHATAQTNTTTIPPVLSTSINTTMYTTSDPTTAQPTSFMPTVSPTKYPSSSPTQEPTIEPTYMPSGDPTINPTVQPITDPIKINVQINITVTNATEEEIKLILEDLLSITFPKYIIDNIEYTKDESTDTISYTFTIDVASMNEANTIKSKLEGIEFKNALETNIETEIEGADVSNINTSAAIIDTTDDDDDKPKAKWLDPTTYGLLNWIIFGAACCILCIFCLFICRCCFLCCSKTRRMKRTRSGYQVGQAMFNQIDSNAEHESAFQSDLRSAIEMNSKGKLLNKVESLGSLDPDAVNTAFDVDVDERKPINNDNNKNKEKQDVKEDENDKKDKEDKEEQKGKKKMSEGIVKPETTTTTLGTTPGGPTPGGPDDEENPPPAPKPPANVQDDDEDYALL